MKVAVGRNKKSQAFSSKRGNQKLLGSAILNFSGFHLCKMYAKEMADIASKNKVLKRSFLF